MSKPTFAETIQAARQVADLTQAELAEKVGVSQSFIAHIEAGRKLPNLECLKAIAAATKIPFTIDGKTQL